jgi:hypothetical protein
MAGDWISLVKIQWQVLSMAGDWLTNDVQKHRNLRAILVNRGHALAT